jgi:hypothetical protein
MKNVKMAKKLRSGLFFVSLLTSLRSFNKWILALANPRNEVGRKRG